jgi:MFS family permease
MMCRPPANKENDDKEKPPPPPVAKASFSSFFSSSSSSASLASHGDTNDQKVTTTTSSFSSADNLQKRALWYGTLSLTCVVIANSLLMGHKQSRLDALGCDALCNGYMTSVRSALTVIGSTWIGRLSDSTAFDQLGGARRFFLMIGAMASAMGIVVAATATSLTVLWWSLIPGALLQHNFNILKALLGSYPQQDKEKEEKEGDDAAAKKAAKRASSVGTLGMAAGLGFMIGPPLGSRLCETYEQASIVALVFLVAAMVAILFLPEPTTVSVSSSSSSSLTPVSTTTVAAVEPSSSPSWKVPTLIPMSLRTPPVLFLMSCRTCMALAFHIFNILWTATLKTRFGFGPKDYGTFFGYIGLVFALSQGFGAKWVLQRFAGSSITKRMQLLVVCCILLGGGRCLLYLTHSLVVVYMIYGGIITALGVVNTVFNADTSQVAPPQELGSLFGLLASVETLAGIAGPIVGGALTRFHPTIAPLMAVAVLYGIVLVLILWNYESMLTMAPSSTTSSSSSSSAASKPLQQEAILQQQQMVEANGDDLNGTKTKLE